MKLIFAGTPTNAAQALRQLAASREVSLVITREDAAVGRSKTLQESAVAKAARELGLRVLKANRITSEHLSMISEAGAELAVVVAYGALIPKTALDILPWWNLHFSLLPKWRGATPLQHSIMHQGEGAGVTVFELDSGLDTGGIIAQQEVTLLENETTALALPRFTNIGMNLLLEALINHPSPVAQNGDPTFAPKIMRSDAQLDFTSTSNQIAAKIQALNPEPMAWCELSGQPLRIVEAVSLGNTNWGELGNKTRHPGEVWLEHKQVRVACANGTVLELRIVQPAGKKQMSAADWYRGLNGEVILE
ncbi:MAG: methionyl-tRNA formyltransferase [Aquiluna sp.]|nr:methionyl-tRNA formyltransferase [Aquiluna sp.]MCF8545070.1 methionyl-tRNA formyltransferase [Aquiluna sp.]